MEFEKLPEIITAAHIAKYLQISRTRVYEMCQWKESAGGLISFRIGATIRVKKVDFIKWLDKQGLAQTS